MCASCHALSLSYSEDVDNKGHNGGWGMCRIQLDNVTCALLRKKASCRLLRRSKVQRGGCTAPSPQLPRDEMMKTVLSVIKTEKPQGDQTDLFHGTDNYIKTFS